VLDVRAKREARKALNSFVEGCVSILILLALEAIQVTELYILSLARSLSTIIRYPCLNSIVFYYHANKSKHSCLQVHGSGRK